MGKRQFKTEADIARFVKQGYGQGEGSSYKPWLRVQDIPSLGRSRKAPGIKSGRMHHFFSDLEFRYFLLLEFSDLVVDIREQYPLFATSKARDIAAEMGIQYPVFVGTQLPFVLTSDFVVTLQEPGQKKRLAIRTCKYEKDFVDPNSGLWTIDKLDLERAIWAESSTTDWKIVTEKVGSQILFDNLEWLHRSARMEAPLDASPDQQSRFTELVLKAADGDRTMASLVRAASTTTGVPYRSGMKLLKHLLWNKSIVTDIASTPLDPTLKCPKLSIPAIRETNRRVA
ncbi:heteromeric transposase endonuclease subunit TnsA [Oxalobacteraceae sp. CFBP 8763]|nr:heteromeric transposase endonuclease subunit TnsA [Oxalobacteraceae sp. CFBP 8761]MBD8565647.1 heteromeric transposase endonuclease subunit TnsA [Oxalobacteraceae sp. CFBP 8763]